MATGTGSRDEGWERGTDKSAGNKSAVQNEQVFATSDPIGRWSEPPVAPGAAYARAGA
jgi:hypothetical protein